MANIIRSKHMVRFLYFLPCILTLVAFACSSKSEFAGIYRTDASADPIVSELEFNDGGEGTWRVGDKEETFAWYTKGDKIRLNTKKGGVIVANLQGNMLNITLSGGRKLSFKKIE